MFVAANWKMNLDKKSIFEFFKYSLALNCDIGET